MKVLALSFSVLLACIAAGAADQPAPAGTGAADQPTAVAPAAAEQVTSVGALPAQQPAAGADPVQVWQRRVAARGRQVDADLRVARTRGRIAMGLASEEFGLNTGNASHERAAAAWAASEALRASANDAPARQAYVQALAAANQQYKQTVAAAFQAWQQAVSQSHQAFQQDCSTAMQAWHTDLDGLLQSCAKAVPGHEEPFTSLSPEGWVLPEVSLADGSSDAETALAASQANAHAKYRTAIDEATRAWQESIRKSAQPAGNAAPEEASAESRWRKANRLWLSIALTALEDLRADLRSAQRKYELAQIPD